MIYNLCYLYRVLIHSEIIMPSQIPEPKFLSVPESARICGVSRNTVYMWVRKGKLGAYQTPGRTNLVRPSDLVKFMQENGMFVPNSLMDLARQDERQDDAPRATSDSGSATADKELSFLVVDDDPMSRSLAARALKGFASIYQAETGYEALHILTMHKEVSLVLLDLRMPGQHGTETLKELRRIAPNVKVIVVSGFAHELPESMIGTAGGVSCVLEKPVTVQHLKDTVAEVSAA